MIPACTCPSGQGNFYCPIMKRMMSKHLHHLCSTNESFRKSFHIMKLEKEMKDKEPKMPSIKDMAKNFGKSAIEHIKNGMQHVSPEEQQRRLDICNLCDKKQGNRCSECGCFLQIKTSWASSECPLKKW